MLAVAAAAIAAAWVSPIRFGIVSGVSMDPTMKDGQPFIYTRLEDGGKSVGHGDVVVFRRKSEIYVKRVFALGGETVYAAQARGRVEREPILVPRSPGIAEWRQRYPQLEYRPIPIPRGSVFVLGDGICSMDSRRFGPISGSAICGRVVGSSRQAGNTPGVMAWVRPHRTQHVQIAAVSGPGRPPRPSRRGGS